MSGAGGTIGWKERYTAPREVQVCAFKDARQETVQQGVFLGLLLLDKIAYIWVYRKPSIIPSASLVQVPMDGVLCGISPLSG